MKPILVLILSAALAHAESVKDLKFWTIEGAVQMDPSKPGPDGKPSFRVDPKSKATLKLRDSDGSGKLTVSVYDDGTVARPDHQKSVGPRWGTSDTNGRVLTGAIMYNPHLHPEGSLCLLDTDPSQKNAWLAFKFLAPRSAPGWKKWEFDYQPEAGLKIVVDGKEVAQRYFDWNSSQAKGFRGIVLYGDDTEEGKPQTIWVGGVDYELGPPMNVTPGSLPTPTPAPPTAPKGPAPEEETEKSSVAPILGKMEGFVPGPALLDDLKNLKIPLVDGYASQHPRLLFFANDREALVKRSLERADLWNAVLASANGVKSPDSVPAPDVIRSGAKYWRIERVQSAALAWFVTGEKEYRDGAVRWMLAHCKEAVWGDKYRPNLDLVASWYLYHIAVAYDILKGEMTEEECKTIEASLAGHARHIYIDHDPYNAEMIPYDQNHTYIPAVALSAAALALLEDVPEAKHWLTRSYAILRRSRYVQSEDGYYYEGFGYWTYALNWQVRGAELLARATGEKLFGIPVLRDSWLFGLHISLPGGPGAFGVGDSGGWADGKLGQRSVTNHAMLWEIASQTGSGESRTIGDLYQQRKPEQDYPATAFLWFNPKPAAAPLDKIPPYHYFPDQDVVAWRSGWGDDATSYLFRCGPPLGHKAAAKLNRFKDWKLNCGHVHPDIGGFWMFAKGAYLAIDTGYTAAKWTRDHNTLLVDEKGQGQDGTYWNEKGIPYGDLDGARITSQYLGVAYGFARGVFGSAYKRNVPGVELTRSLLMTKRWLLIIDEMTADKTRSLTWFCHSVGEFGKEGAAYVSRQEAAALAVLPLAPSDGVVAPEPTVVFAGTAPGRGTEEKRGFKLSIRSAAPVANTRFVNLLVPLDLKEMPPEAKLVKNEGDRIELEILWPDGKTEAVTLDLGWKAGASRGPAQFSSR
ncbi:MAG: DUF4962 domain-containing protein [Verrucomicrobiota bacterium]